MTAVQSPDADLWSGIQQDSARKLLLAALNLFARRGFQATSTREIAAVAGLSPAAMYVFYRNKAELLFEISRVGHEAVLRVIEEATGQYSCSSDRMRALVHDFTSWHARHNMVARVAQYELQHMEPKHYEVIADLRRRIAAMVRSELAHGAESGEFDLIDIQRTTLAILSLQIDVARWYSASGSWSPEDIGQTYADLVIRMLQPSISIS
jgi:AcrR family transcriptional regulator